MSSWSDRYLESFSRVNKSEQLERATDEVDRNALCARSLDLSIREHAGGPPADRRIRRSIWARNGLADPGRSLWNHGQKIRPSDFVRHGGTTRAERHEMPSTTIREAREAREEAKLRGRAGARPRLREHALERGVELLGDHELVALLVERGTEGEPLEQRVERLLREAGGLPGLCSRGVGAMVSELGLGLACGARLAAAIELGVRAARLAHDVERAPATSAFDVERWARRRLVGLAHEELWALLLDTRNRIVAERMLARGGLHACALTARDVLRPVVREASSAFVLVHNHPGGDPCPSREDVGFTRKVHVAASTLGVTLVDHVVVARDGHVSMLEAGLFGADLDLGTA